METRSLIKQMTLLVLGILILGTIAIAFLAFHTALNQDKTWQDGQEHVLSSVLASEKANLQQLALDYARRPGVVAAANSTSSDLTAIVRPLSELHSITIAGFADAAGRVVNAVRSDKPAPLASDIYLPLPAGDNVFSSFEGEVGFLAMAPVPNVWPARNLFFFSAIEARIPDLAANTEIGTLHLVDGEDIRTSSSISTLSLRGNRGTEIAQLVWSPEQPGMELLASIIQPVLIILAFMIVLTYAVVKRGEFVAKRLDDATKQEIARTERIARMNDLALELIEGGLQNIEGEADAGAITERLAAGLECDATAYWQVTGVAEIATKDIFKSNQGTHGAGLHLRAVDADTLLERLSLNHVLRCDGAGPNDIADLFVKCGITPSRPRAAIVVALLIDRKIAGFIGAAATREDRTWTVEEAAFAERIADIATLALESRHRREAEAVSAEARKTAEIANRSKSEFLAKMSHELRTPLNSIIGFSGTIENEDLGPAPETYRDFARDIKTSGEHLLTIINDILDAARLDHGSFQIIKGPVDVLQTVSTVGRIMRGKAEDSGVRLDVDIPDNLPSVPADERRLRQVLINLVSNAVKFSPEGGAVKITARELDGELRLEVRDEGIGMTDDEIRSALGLFRQVDNGLDRKHEGTGLGLPIAEGLVHLHGGRFEIESKPGQGTTVAFTLPLDSTE